MEQTAEVEKMAGVDKTPETEQPKTLGTKWLRCWIYGSLPLGGFLSLIYPILIAPPSLSTVESAIWIAWAPFAFILAFGLHKRKLWAWKINWIAVVLGYITYLFPASPHPGVEFVIRLVLASLIWMWPNWIYWRKRKHLFID